MRKFYIFLLTIILSGCTITSKPQSSQSIHVTLLSPMIKINDIGFLHSYKNELNLQIYSFGTNTADIKITDKICINSVCFEKKEFNQKFFKNTHYDEIFSDILLKKPIYDGINLIKTPCGFTQNIKDYIIKYEVCDNNANFADTQNRIKIMLKEIK